MEQGHAASEGRWEDLPKAQRERLETELRARGIDPRTVRSVRFEQAGEPPAAASTPGEDGLIDLAAGQADGDARGAGGVGGADGRTIRSERIEININGEKRVYSSKGEVPIELRGVIDALKAQTEGVDGGKRSNVTVTHTVVRQIDGKDFPTDEIMSLLRQGKKIEAIKVLRERTGVGLAEAKQTIDAIDATIEGGKRRSGCAGMIVLAAGVGIALGIAAGEGFALIL
jgi:ribosomal protein L7/L12